MLLLDSTAVRRRIAVEWDSNVDPQPIFFLNSDGLHVRLILALAEFTRKIENSANLRLNVNNCG